MIGFSPFLRKAFLAKPISVLVPSLLLVLLISGCANNSPRNKESSGVPSEIVQRQLDLGMGYLRNGDYQRAKMNLNRALDIDSKSAAVHAAFGLLFQLEGEKRLAEQYFDAAIKYDPDSAQARNSYGAFLFSEKRYPEAIEQLTQAANNRFYNNRPMVFENLGVAYMQIGDKEQADYAFTRAVQLNPEQPRALLELANIRFDEQDYTAAQELYRRHTKVSSRSPKTLLLCVKLARIFGRSDEQASCAEALEGIFPTSPEYQEYRESF